MGAVLMCGPTNGDLYAYRPTSSSATTQSNTIPTIDLWHARFGHPFPKFLTQMLSTYGLSMNSSSKVMNCNSCTINKSHKLPLSISSIQTTSPLELIFSYV